MTDVWLQNPQMFFYHEILNVSEIFYNEAVIVIKCLEWFVSAEGDHLSMSPNFKLFLKKEFFLSNWMFEWFCNLRPIDLASLAFIYVRLGMGGGGCEGDF